MSNLVDHARTELERIGEESEFIEGYLKVIQAFADMGHSGGSAAVAVPTINRLLRYQHLAPISDNPDDWMDVSGALGGTQWWQCRRNGALFSSDGGRTYYDLDSRRLPRWLRWLPGFVNGHRIRRSAPASNR